MPGGQQTSTIFTLLPTPLPSTPHVRDTKLHMTICYQWCSSIEFWYCLINHTLLNRDFVLFLLTDWFLNLFKYSLFVWLFRKRRLNQPPTIRITDVVLYNNQISARALIGLLFYGLLCRYTHGKIARLLNSGFTNSPCVLPTSRMVCQPINHKNVWSIAYCSKLWNNHNL